MVDSFEDFEHLLEDLNRFVVRHKQPMPQPQQTRHEKFKSLIGRYNLKSMPQVCLLLDEMELVFHFADEVDGISPLKILKQELKLILYCC